MPTSATLKNTNLSTIHRRCDRTGVIRNFVRRYICALHEATRFFGCNVIVRSLESQYHNDNEAFEYHDSPRGGYLIK